MGQIGVLNVGAGDTKLSFDKNNPAECIRSARIVSEMLKRGYALLVEDPEKPGTYVRAHAFREDTCEYIIADYDPTVIEETASERNPEPADEPAAEAPARKSGPKSPLATPKIAGGRVRNRAIKAQETSGISVSRSAGG